MPLWLLSAAFIRREDERKRAESAVLRRAEADIERTDAEYAAAMRALSTAMDIATAMAAVRTAGSAAASRRSQRDRFDASDDLWEADATIDYDADIKALSAATDAVITRLAPLVGAPPAVVAPVSEKAKADDPPERVCGVCMENRKDTAFQCGHIHCAACAHRLDICPECRTPIRGRTKLYGLYT